MESFKGIRRLAYNASTAGWALLDSIFMTFYVVFLLPPKEKIAEGMIAYISNRTFLGVLTVLGSIMIFGRIVDAVADPLVASWSDRSRSHLGRRRLFLILGGLPLAVFPVLIFFPPVPDTSWVNAVYLALIFGGYFFAFTVYVGPYLALIPELGHTKAERIGMTTAQGYFSLLGNAAVMIGGPLLLTGFLRGTSSVVAYQRMAIVLAVPGVIVVRDRSRTSADPSRVTSTSCASSRYSMASRRPRVPPGATCVADGVTAKTGCGKRAVIGALVTVTGPPRTWAVAARVMTSPSKVGVYSRSSKVAAASALSPAVVRTRVPLRTPEPLARPRATSTSASRSPLKARALMRIGGVIGVSATTVVGCASTDRTTRSG